MPEFRRRLPHIHIDLQPVFITWRLKFSLPQCLLRQLQERESAFELEIESLSDEFQKLQRYQFNKKQFDFLDTFLGQDHSLPSGLTQAEPAAIIENSLQYLDKRKYVLHAYCIMPNHIHLLITPLHFESSAKSELSSITQSLKGYTARKINQYLNREGSFWHSESYDHYIRSDQEFYRVVDYIIQNPVKAKLVQSWLAWPHTWLELSLSDRLNPPHVT